LRAAAVQSLLPGPTQQTDLVERAFHILVEGTAQAPATPEIAPRAGSFAHAMPAYVREGDITSLKWISGFVSNRDVGLPYLSGLIVVNDSDTGLPVAVMDCAAITAARTAAVSAVCVRSFARAGWSRLAVIGYGVQARAHIALFRELFSGLEVRVASRRPRPPRAGVSFNTDPRVAVGGADVVVTAIPLEIHLDPPIKASWLAEGATILPLDDDASLDPSVANAAARFYVDDLDDFALRRASGHFGAWREPDGSVASAVLADAEAAGGRTVCANQGMGLLDAVFARAVLDAAERDNVGDLLDR
jgi:ornithine cyclodeaminase/alanine dehydrogenase